MRRLLHVPFFVVLMGIGSLAMLVPAIHGYVVRDWDVARGFLYYAILGLLLTTMITIAMRSHVSRNIVRTHLMALPIFFGLLPLLLALPVREVVGDTTYLNAYFEMVASLTTTGATLFDAPGRVPDSIHLWRAIVGWIGGLFIWVAAFAILSPMNLGGFEVTATGTIGRGAQRLRGEVRNIDAPERLLRYAMDLTPIYAIATGALWVLLLMAGETPFIAACHAMSTLATSGISPVGGLSGGQAGFMGEVVLLPFLFFAITRLIFNNENKRKAWWVPGRDPEVTMASLCVIIVPLFLFLRHWVGAYDFDDEQNLFAAVKALWGSVFTVISFLTTTGFASADWETARNWSGLQTPGMILLGLCIIGGGVATTAGGVKLLRVYALYRHGLREMDKLVHPSSVGGAGQLERHIRRQGAMVAWIFFMLFALSIAGVMLLLSLAGLDFESSTILGVAALSNTGPVAQEALHGTFSYADLNSMAKIVLAGAMILGRVETLAIIALLNPSFWRR